MWFLKSKIRREEEQIAKLQGQLEVLKLIVKSEHTTWDRDRLFKVHGDLCMHKKRREHLLACAERKATKPIRGGPAI